MIALQFNIQGEGIIEDGNVFTFSMQEEDILEHTNANCYLLLFSQIVGHCVT
jgi:hypothetical protein